MTKNCAVKIEFSAAKRLLDFEGKCNQLHGYRHVVEATFENNIDASMVIDFYEAKRILGNWIDENLDHNVILNQQDKPLGQAIEGLTGQSVFYMECDPTAENMASYIKDKICPEIFPKSIKCTKIRLYDTDSAWVEV